MRPCSYINYINTSLVAHKHQMDVERSEHGVITPFLK